MATTSPATTQPKVIGRRRTQAQRETFQLAVYRGEKEELWEFTVRAQMDTSSVFSLSADNVTPGERLGGLRNFLMRAFVDDDGVSIDDVPTRVTVAPHDVEGDDENEPVKAGQLVPIDDDDTDTRGVQWKMGDSVFPSESLARQYGDEHGSSLRRLIYVMDSPRLIVEQTALEEMVDVIVSAAADRPTEQSGASLRSPRRARRSEAG
jgi:hypothetical protein